MSFEKRSNYTILIRATYLFSIVNYVVIFVSALTVRFLTKRYIGEYDHQQGTVFKYITQA